MVVCLRAASFLASSPDMIWGSEEVQEFSLCDTGTSVLTGKTASVSSGPT
jgi:hypothetical protein